MALVLKRMSRYFSCISVVCCEHLLMVKALWLPYAWPPAVTEKPLASPRGRNLIARDIPYLDENPSDLMKT